MKRFAYWRLHIPTGKRSVGEMDAWDLAHLLRELNRYNAQQPGTWQYWIEPNQQSGRTV
jgi:hypothetical protein